MHTIKQFRRFFSLGFISLLTVLAASSYEGIRDSGGLEIHDIYDAIIAVRSAYPGMISSDRVYITGGSLVMDRYRARASNLASGNNPYTAIHLFVNEEETICPPIDTSSYRDNALASGQAPNYDNIHVYIGALDTWEDFNGNIFLNEIFADGNRTGQNLPNSADWFTAGSLTDVVSEGEWIFQSPGDTAEFTAVAYFTDGAPVTLAEEESIAFRFNLTAEDVSSDSPSTGFRLGLFNSKGQRLTADVALSEDPVFANYAGYGAMLTLDDSTQSRGVRMIRRTAANDNLLGRGAAYTTLAETTSPVMAANTIYQVVFRVSRLDADSVQLSVSLDGSMVGIATTSGVVDFDFDSVGLWTTGRNRDIHLSNLEVALEVLEEQVSNAIGKVRPRHALEIEDSPWSIGAETMDRRFTIYDNWREYLGPLGVKYARIQSGWAAVETEAGVYDWTILDNVIFDMPTQGVTPWVNLGYGNAIYPDGGNAGVESPLPSGSAALEAWDNFIVGIVSRYQNYVNEWEIWNEPDHGSFYKTPQEYGDFVIRTAETIRGVQPEAVIIICAVTGNGMNSYVSDTVAHLASLDKLHLVDIVSYHPYASNPDTVYSTVASMMNKVKAIDPTITFMQGENGAPSEQQTRFALRNEYWSETTQAKWALRRMLGDWGRGIRTSLFGIMEMDYTGEDNSKGLLALPGDRFLDRADEDKVVDHVKRGYFAVQHLTSIFDSKLVPLSDFQYSTASSSVQAFGFQNSEGQAAVALWNGSSKPTDTELSPLTPGSTISFPDLTFADPVLVDLLTGEIFGIDDWQVADEGSTFGSIPIYDSPIIIIASLVPMRDLAYLEWFDQHFADLGPVEEAALTSMAAAPAGDGVVNGIKYLLDLDPFTPVASPFVYSMEGDMLQITVNKRVDESLVQVTPQVSENLLDWRNDDATIEVVRVPDGTGFEVYTVREKETASPSERRFLRLRFSWFNM